MALNTRDRILDAFFELADKQPDRLRFTFTEIAKEAGLSRQAIYKRHFNNTTEIIEYIRQDMVKQAFAPNWNSNNSEAGLDPFAFWLKRFFPLFMSNANALKYYILVLSIPCGAILLLPVTRTGSSRI